MGNHHNRCAVLVERFHQRHHPVDSGPVLPSRRFVDDEDIRLHHKDRRDRDHLALALAKRERMLLFLARKPRQSQSLLDAPLAFFFVNIDVLEAEFQFLIHRV
ncbi:hypothetical protein SDC9_211132 [bioreactor metagenome]|uniref:Uncharacterized protein n=1 Tax=bioreactor metagenome TaxID=1076179 RepID=A0A645JTW5_9ZZZZ